MKTEGRKETLEGEKDFMSAKISTESIKMTRVGRTTSEEARRAKLKGLEKPGDCVFCGIVAGRLPSFTVYQDDRYIAFLDAHPYSRGHTLVCPKKHGETIWDMDEGEIGGLFLVAARVSKGVVHATDADGFRFVQNNGEAANQVVPHVHIHTIPVKLADKGRWMERKSFTSREMEDTAGKIRAAIAKENGGSP